jgi:hypothetical protein
MRSSAGERKQRARAVTNANERSGKDYDVRTERREEREREREREAGRNGGTGVSTFVSVGWPRVPAQES